MQISTQWERRARLARLPEHVPWRRKWIIATEQGTKQCNFVCGGLEELILRGEIKSGESAEYKQQLWLESKVTLFSGSARQRDVY